MSDTQSTVEKNSALNVEPKDSTEQLIETIELPEKNAEDLSDPLDTNNKVESSKVENQTRDTAKKSLLDDIVDAILPKIKNPVGIIIDIDERKTAKSEEQSVAIN